MCIMGLCIRVNENYPVIFCHNRDELLARDTQDAKLQDDLQVVCGIDNVLKGTWGGLNVQNGTFCFLTNILPPLDKFYSSTAKSRGMLVLDYLHSGKIYEGKNSNYNPNNFNGFNLFHGNLLEMKFSYLSNRNIYQDSSPMSTLGLTYNITTPTITNIINSKNKVIEEVNGLEIPLEKGVHVVSNSYLEDSSWNKVVFLHEQLELICKADISSFADETARKKRIIDGDINNSTDIVAESINNIVRQIGDVLCSRPYCNQSDEADTLKESLSNLFVDYQFDANGGNHLEEWKTRSQSIVILDKNNVVHYFYRNTEKFRIFDHKVDQQNTPFIKVYEGKIPVSNY